MVVYLHSAVAEAVATQQLLVVEAAVFVAVVAVELAVLERPKWLQLTLEFPKLHHINTIL